MKKWTKEEIDYIVNNHGKIFIKEIARDLGRTKGSVILVYIYLLKNCPVLGSA